MPLQTDWIALRQTQPLPKLKNHSPRLGNSAVYALFGLIFALLLIVGAIFWIAQKPSPSLTVHTPFAHHYMGAIDVFTTLEQHVEGLHSAQTIAVLAPTRPDQTVAFNDEKGDWFLIASFEDEQQALADAQSANQAGYVAVLQGNCLIITDEDSANGSLVWEIIKEARGG